MPDTNEMFAAAIRKLDRSDEHFRELEQLLIDYAKSNPARVVLKPSYHHFTSPPKTYIDVSAVVIKEPSEKIKDVLGDFFHNLRSALDTALFPLVKDNFANPKQIQFLISDSEVRFNDDFGKRFAPHLNKGTVSAICGAKPFKEGNPLIHALSELNNIDKHRYQLTASAEGAITADQLASIVPPGTNTPPNQIVLGGNLLIRVVGKWSEPKELLKFISNSDPLYLPAMVSIKPPSYEYPQAIFQICFEIKKEVRDLVQKIIGANG